MTTSATQGTPISGLPAATTFGAADLLVIVQGGVTKQIPYSASLVVTSGQTFSLLAGASEIVSSGASLAISGTETHSSGSIATYSAGAAFSIGAGASLTVSSGAAISGLPVLNGVNAWSGGNSGTIIALSSGASVATNFALGNNFSYTITTNGTLANPSNVVAGQSGVISVTQGSGGSFTLAYGANWKFAGGTAPVLSTTAAAVDVLAYYARTATAIYASLANDVK